MSRVPGYGGKTPGVSCFPPAPVPVVKLIPQSQLLPERFIWREGDVEVADEQKHLPVVCIKYRPDQPRDENGRWVAGGGDFTLTDNPGTVHVPYKDPPGYKLPVDVDDDSGGEDLGPLSDAIKAYQKSGQAEKMNEALRKGKALTDQQKSIAKVLDEAIAAAPESNKTLWRGDQGGFTSALFRAKPLPGGFNFSPIFASRASLRAWEEKLNEHFAGVVVKDKGFVSTSAARGLVLDEFLYPTIGVMSAKNSAALIEIRGRSRSLDIGKLSTPSARNDFDEMEHLLARGSKFKVESVKLVNQWSGGAYLHWKVSPVL